METREKKVLIFGAVAVALILFVGYGPLPMLRSFLDTREILLSRAADVAALKSSVLSQESVLDQRNALVARMGSLFITEAPKPAEKPSTTAKDSKTEAPAKVVSTAKDEKTETKNHPVKEAATSPISPAPKPSPAPQAGTDKPKSDQPPNSTPAEATKTPSTDKAPAPVAPDAKTPEPGSKSDSKLGDKPAPKPNGSNIGGMPKPGESPGSQLAGSLAAYVEQSGKQAGATIKRITPRKSQGGYLKSETFHPVMLQVQMDCSLDSFVKVLQSLEKGERFVRVDQMQVRRNTKGGGNMDVTLDIRSYELDAG